MVNGAMTPDEKEVATNPKMTEEQVAAELVDPALTSIIRHQPHRLACRMGE